MAILTLIIAIAALAVGIASLLRKPKQMIIENVVEKIVEKHNPESPFNYEEASCTWHLKGNLDVAGYLSCLDKKNEEKK